MVLIILFSSEFWLGILDLKNAKNLKKNVSEELRKSYSETYSKRRFIFRNRFGKTSYYPQQPTIFSYCC